MSETLPNPVEVRKLLASITGQEAGTSTFLTHVHHPVSITVDKLRALVASNPKHPKSPVLLKATEGYGPNQEMQVDEVDLLAVSLNRDVITTQSVVSGERYSEKSLGKSL